MVNAPSDNNCYQVAHFFPRFMFEIIIIWQFLIIQSNCNFLVIHSGRPK